MDSPADPALQRLDKGKRMSSVPSLSFAASTLPTSNVRPHGHRRGSHAESTSSSIGSSSSSSTSSSATPVPAAAQQNAFSSLLQSLEQAIGIQSGTATAVPAVSGSATPASTVSGAGAAAAAVVVFAAAGTPTQSASALLQNYLNNRSHGLQANGSQTLKIAGSNVKVSA
jgi:hypothetical protein